jgi:CheY-like chemotaxis protein
MLKRTILLVEDNPADLELILRALDKSGIQNPVVSARDGTEAMRQIIGPSWFLWPFLRRR